MSPSSLRSLNSQSTSSSSDEFLSAHSDAITETTETVCSDDPAPASSGIFAQATLKFSLEQSFPSILSTVDLMRLLSNLNDVDGFRSLSQVFLTCLRTILRSMDDLPHDVRLNPDYEVAQYEVTVSGNLLKTEVSKETNSGDPKRTNVATAIEFVHITISNLRSFLKVAERLLTENKPLPALPTVTPATNLEPAPPVNLVDQKLNADAISETSSPSSVKSDNSSAVRPVKKSCRGNLIRRIVSRKLASSKRSLFTSRSRSSVTLVDLEDTSTSAKPTEVKPHSSEYPYVPRQSTFYYLADPHNPEVDVDMPLPTGDTVAVRLDQYGTVKAASLTALVRILTSKESVLDQDFTPTFFICFRFFTTPMLFLQELIRRYDEQPPDSLNPAQLRIWTRAAMGTRLRVGKAILMWLDLYWRPESDSEVLGDLKTFVLERSVRGLPEGMSALILEKLDFVWSESTLGRRKRKADDLEFISSRMAQNELIPTGFHICIWIDEDLISQLLRFNSSTGREEFARQLTVRVSKKFQRVDPLDAIEYWHRNEDSEVGKVLREIISFERSLSSWVTSTVLERSTPQERCEILEFWLDISVRCVRMRNYSGAHSIFGGISNGSIGRMKYTVLLVRARSKEQFRALDNFFGGRDNFADYREALTSVEPTVPMIAPLIRDVISALDVVPTSVGATENSEKKNLVNLCSYRVITKTVRSMESCLIRYKISKSKEFHIWLNKGLARFPPHLDTQTNDNFYLSSTKLEPREPLLKHLMEPWSYTISGLIPGKFTLHPLPTPYARRQIKTKKGISALFRLP